MRAIDADKLLRDIEEYHVSDGKFQHWVQIQPTIEPEPCKDAVSRADVLECFADLYDTFEDCSKGIINELHRKFEDLRTLPSVTQDRCDTCRFVYYPKETNNNDE